MRVSMVTVGLIIAAATAGCAGGHARAARDPTLVQTREGAVKGVLDGDLVTFKGVPYAAPPVGPLRWRPPQPPTSREGVLEATTFGRPCPSVDGTKIQQGKQLSGAYDIFIGVPDAPGSSEDCLHLNIWAPVDANRAAVMVWIQPLGPAAYSLFDGAALARQGVVIVTMDYRQLTLGNFAHAALTREAKPDEPLSRFQTMDQMAALRWVKQNIAAFGGDPGNVTAFGESAGGASTLQLLTIPESRELVDKAIVQSGFSWGSPFSLEEMEALGSWAATQAGLSGKDATAAQLRALYPDSLPKFGIYSVDGRLQSESATTAIAEGRMIDVPLLIGWTDFDGSSLRGTDSATFAERASDRLKVVYAPEGKTDADLGYQMYTDQHVGAPARWVAQQSSAGAPSYLYLFSYVRTANRGKVRGAAHGDDMSFVFDTWGKTYPQLQLSEEDRAATRMMQSCWVTFAKTGKPRCEGAPNWPPYTRASDQLMDLALQPQVLTGFRKTQLDAQEDAMQDVIDSARRSVEDLIRRAESGQIVASK
jgi:para-nitrobenzyl esterase